MTPNLLPLYVACFATIGLLAGFARHNKRTGWVKKRRSVFEDLLDLQAFAKDLDGAEETRAEPAMEIRLEPAASVPETVQFSTQLAGLNAGLRAGATASSPAAAAVEEHSIVEEKEHVSA